MDFYNYKCKLKKVVDGDTVDVDIDLGFDMWMVDQRIRLMGVDTPESRTSDLVEKEYGIIAKNFVLNSLLEEQSKKGYLVLKTTKDGTGKFGRILGDFLINDESLVDTLIKKHMGVAYFGQDKSLIRQEHLKNRQLLES